MAIICIGCRPKDRIYNSMPTSLLCRWKLSQGLLFTHDVMKKKFIRYLSLGRVSMAIVDSTLWIRSTTVAFAGCQPISEMSLQYDVMAAGAATNLI